MSVTLSRLKRPGPFDKLYLKTPDGTVRGPLGVTDICKLAIQNRIPPGSKVSDDRAIWSPAEMVEELKLEWDAKCTDGRTIGPYNLLAIPLLVHDGTLVGGDVLVNRVSNRSVQVRDLIKPDTPIVRRKGAAAASRGPDLASGQQELFAQAESSDKEHDPVDGSPLMNGKAREAGQPVDHVASETRRVGGPDEKRMKEHRGLSDQLADVPRDGDVLREGDEILLGAMRTTEAAQAGRAAELERALSNSAAESVRSKSSLDQEKAQNGEWRRVAADKEQQAAGRIKELEAEARTLGSRLAQSVRAMEELTRKDENLHIDSRRREEECGLRISQLERQLGTASGDIAKLKADQEYERATHAETRRLSLEKEKQAAGRIKELDAQAKEFAVQLAAAQQVAIEIRQKDEALQLEIRKKDADVSQKAEQLRRSLEARVSDGSRLKAELDREKALHAETRRMDGEREQQIVGRMKELEIKLREAAARMAESTQLAEERRRKYEAIQQEIRQKEGDAILRAEQLGKSADAASKAVREIQQRLEDDQAAHAQAQKNWRKREQELMERIARTEADAAALSGVVEQVRIDAEKQKIQDQNTIDQGKARETQLVQRLSQLKVEHEQSMIAFEQARKKLAEKRMTPVPAVDPAVSEKEKRLAISLTQMEKQVENSTLALDQARAETERVRRELVRTGERLSASEKESRERIGELERTAQVAMQAAEVAKKAGDEQARQCRRLTEENASLGSRMPALQAEIANVAGAARAAKEELAAAQRIADEAGKALREERRRHEMAMEAAAAERGKLQSKLARTLQEPARVAERAGKRRAILQTLSIAAVASVIAFLGGIGIRGTMVASVVREPASHENATGSIDRTVAAPAMVVQSLPAIPATNRTSERLTAAVPTGVVKAAVQPPVAAVLKWPDVSVDGLQVTRTNRTVVMIFSYGVFSSMANLREQAKTDLELIAGQLKNKMDGLAMVVVGHTDTVPLSTNTAYSGNYELGLARAKAAADYLIQECGMPTGSVVATSAGGSPITPYPNMDAESRKKNRTVVLRLVPLQDAPKPPAAKAR
ncbi:MAG: OmpA family protein [bacterium]